MRGGASLSLAAAAGLLLLQLLAPGAVRVQRWVTATLVLLGLVLTALNLLFSASAVVPSGTPAWDAVVLLATETWAGRMTLLRLSTATAALALLALRGRLAAVAGLLLIGASLFLIPFSGHAVTAEPVGVSLALHGVHVCSVLLWTGGVTGLLAFSFASGAESHVELLLRRFSPVALLLVIVGVFAGLGAGYLQAGAGAALLGTFYGQLLILKCLLLVGVALPCAAWLRLKFLAHPAVRRSPRLAIAVEAAGCLAIVVVATLMSQSIPARHDDIVWPLPFRLDLNRLNPGRGGSYTLLAHLLFGSAMLALAAIAAILRRWTFVWVTASMGLLIGAIALGSMIAPAYPTTFAMLQSSFSAETLSSVEPVFMTKCAPCHGGTGRGDGPVMVSAGKRAADLTAPHAGYHTPGDIYWWITHGRQGSPMPGFEDDIPEQQRWDLVNYLKLISYSARAKDVASGIAEGRPFLPSMDFGFVSSDGGPVRLRDLEGEKAVLLIVDLRGGDSPRLREMSEAAPDVANAGAFIVSASPGPASGVEQEAGILRIDPSDFRNVADAWSHYSGVPAAGSSQPEHMEFLIDRFGYVRARWQDGASVFPTGEEVLLLVEKLAAEPRILPSPEEHSH